MAKPAINTQVRQWLESPYKPETSTGIDTEERIAKALAYSAYHLYQISQKLDRLIGEGTRASALSYLQSSQAPDAEE